MKNRSIRRHHRERLINKRSREAINVSGSREAINAFVMKEAGKYHKGALADNQYWLGCNKPDCGLCNFEHDKQKRSDRRKTKIALRREF